MLKIQIDIHTIIFTYSFHVGVSCWCQNYWGNGQSLSGLNKLPMWIPMNTQTLNSFAQFLLFKEKKKTYSKVCCPST